VPGRRHPARKRWDTPAYRDGWIRAQLAVAEHALLMLLAGRGRPESEAIREAFRAVGRAIEIVQKCVETRA